MFHPPFFDLETKKLDTSEKKHSPTKNSQKEPINMLQMLEASNGGPVNAFEFSPLQPPWSRLLRGGVGKHEG